RQFRTPIALASYRHEPPKIALRLCHVTAMRRGLRRTVEAAETLGRALLGGGEHRERLGRSLQCEEQFAQEFACGPEASRSRNLPRVLEVRGTAHQAQRLFGLALGPRG